MIGELNYLRHTEKKSFMRKVFEQLYEKFVSKHHYMHEHSKAVVRIEFKLEASKKFKGKES